MGIQPKAKSQKPKGRKKITCKAMPVACYLLSKTFVFLLIACCLLPFASQAQDTIKKSRPKIGLVLSGGGAKGFAHIGALKVLEQAGVKVDYIGGTSMGAVVGGLYASGYSATQIDSIFYNTNFDELLQDYIPRASKSFFEKSNGEKYAVSLPFEKFKVGVPIALSKGMYNYNLLSKLTHKVRHVNDFSQLPIPFLCVATNIENGEGVVLKNGYLAQAMLASSAFPSLFSPVEIDGKLLIDGGVVDNYPVEEVRQMGADIIIGVDVQDDLKNKEGLKDATKIMVQITNLEMLKKMKEKVKITDIYIKPDVKDFSVISFDEGREIIKIGEEASFAVYERLKKLADTTLVYPLSGLKVKQDSLQIKRVTINKLAHYTRAYVVGKLQFKNDSKISYEDLKNGINNINVTQNFSSISYEFDEFEGGDEFKLDLTENPVKTFVKFGLHYDDLYKSALLVNITQKKTLFKNDITSLDVGLGDNIRYNLDYYLDNGFYWSFGLKSRYNAFNKNISIDFNKGVLLSEQGLNSINVDYSDFNNQAYLQTVFLKKFLMGAGLEFKMLQIKSDNLEDENPTLENSNYTSVFGYARYDTYNNKYFPKKGFLLSGDIQSYLLSSDYTNQFNRFSIVKGEIGFAKTFFGKVAFLFQSEMGFAFGEDSVHFFDFVLGGYGYQPINNFRHFYGYDFLSIQGDSYVKSCFSLDYQFYRKNHVNFSANYANAEDDLFVTGDWLTKPTYNGYAIGYGLETIIGPIEVKYSWSPEYLTAMPLDTDWKP
ncbi:MAG: patatin-like phospholipase family protein [Flavobacterium sp.]